MLCPLTHWACASDDCELWGDHGCPFKGLTSLPAIARALEDIQAQLALQVGVLEGIRNHLRQTLND